MKKKILIAIACLLAIIATVCNIYIPNHKINNTIQETQNIIQEEIKNDNVIITEYVYGESSDVKDATITNKEDISTKQLPEITEAEEKNIEEIKNLTIAVKEIAMETKATREDVNDMNSRLKEVEEKPARNWENLSKTIITRNCNSSSGLFFGKIWNVGGIKKWIVISL